MLKRLKTKFVFESELALENFVWTHLEELLELQPIERQFRVNDQICDILAVDKKQRLHILELKNSLDRYIVQQLTRYYDALLSQKPWDDAIDYSQPIQLIAVCPTFHPHNHVDLKYSTLNFDFLKFEIAIEHAKPKLVLKSVLYDKICEAHIPYGLGDTSNVTEEVETREAKQQKFLDYYIPTKYAHKLGIAPPTKEQVERLGSKKLPRGAKLFKVQMNYLNSSGKNWKTVSVRVPASITVSTFRRWLGKNVPNASSFICSGYSHPVFHGDFIPRESVALEIGESNSHGNE